MARMMMVVMVLALAGCETVKGAGQDIQTAGQAITAEGTQAQAGM
jgi:entericidin B